MSTRDFLVEIGTEELPPKALLKLSRAFEAGLEEALDGANLDHGEIKAFATPRRLALLVSALQEQQPDSKQDKVGPAVKAAFDNDGKPTKAAEGFARSCGVGVDELSQVEKDGVTKLAYSIEEKGQSTATLLPDMIAGALSRLPIPKRMRWGSSRVEFVRPVHWIVMLFGKDVLDATILGITSGNITRGHRFHHNADITLKNPADYESVLETTGSVIADFDRRRNLIREQVLEQASALGAEVDIDAALLDEVTSLVEYPVALTGKFDEQFLEVPPEALVLTMKSHQKCFCLSGKDGQLLPAFITISNLKSKDPAQVIEGNERVIRPRLADARFFFETDKQVSLASRQEQLKSIVFQDKLGTVYDKSVRVATLARHIADALGVDADACERAAMLAKCDLLTNMVGEFADLQGLMGYYYASHDGEPAEVAQAIPEQYMPRYAGDALPASGVGSVLALAEKLDTIVGLFAIGQPPTGSKDPFALRRAAIGVLRILVEKELDLDIRQAIEVAIQAYSTIDTDPQLADQVFGFLLERFRAWYQDEQVAVEIFQAVQAVKPTRPLDFHHRIQAVAQFAAMTEAAALAAANKRVSNILDKEAGEVVASVDPQLLTEAAEKALYEALAKQQTLVDPLFAGNAYADGLSHLASLKDSVDRFFDEVLVMSEDDKVRANRLALLQQLRSLFLRVADISYLHQS